MFLYGILNIVCPGQCDLLVDMYTPRMMEQLENITPEEFCQKAKMCKPPTRILDGNDCATCQFVILELKIKLQDPQTQVMPFWNAEITLLFVC